MTTQYQANITIHYVRTVGVLYARDAQVQFCQTFARRAK
ncbi:hypothetical protein T05_10500 [Trichinella murrelli]|uniref:Uncharacterized protein n=1 Tax=Trichinella murrelli TaxID=144512 RepID=A0A0V0SQY5_9BILA|nr:hypothetical protein T05_10500 [Trichinella murrelli]